jgi:hypothetical protein
MGNFCLYRKWLDENIVYRNGDTFEFLRDESANDDKIQNDLSLRQFQSMLFVSSNEKQDWILEAYLACTSEDKPETFSLELLKKQDRKRHIILPELIDMKFHNIEYYWFYRLDYELWEHRKEYFKYHLEIANRFIFKKRSSVEHIKPQTNPATGHAQSDDRFGNLALITSSENSKLSNNLFGTKKELITIWKDSFPSLKLLHAFAKETWGDEEIKQEGETMHGLLNSLYLDNNI